MGQIVTCPSCSREYANRPELAGKRAKCKCGGRIEFPAESLGEADLLDDAPAARPVKSALSVPVAASPDPYAVKAERSASGPPPLPAPGVAVAPPPVMNLCRNCRGPLSPGTVLCTKCGMNQQTGAMIRTTVTAAPRAFDMATPSYSPPRRASSGNGVANMVIGAILVIIGLAITLGTLAAAEGAGGGTYVVAFGPIIFGGIRFIKGLGQAMSGD